MRAARDNVERATPGEVHRQEGQVLPRPDLLWRGEVLLRGGQVLLRGGMAVPLRQQGAGGAQGYRSNKGQAGSLSHRGRQRPARMRRHVRFTGAACGGWAGVGTLALQDGRRRDSSLHSEWQWGRRQGAGGAQGYRSNKGQAGSLFHRGRQRPAGHRRMPRPAKRHGLGGRDGAMVSGASLPKHGETSDDRQAGSLSHRGRQRPARMRDMRALQNDDGRRGGGRERAGGGGILEMDQFHLS